jgi:glutathione S-transferase
MITVHHLNNSRSQRILWLLEELGAEYQVRRYERDAETMLAPASLRAVHPLGKSPVITDGDVTMAESGAIIEYLADRYGAGRLAPAPGAPERLRYTYGLHYAEVLDPAGTAAILEERRADAARSPSAMPPMLMSLVFNRLRTAPAPFFVRPVARGIADKVMTSFVSPQIKLHLDYMEGELGKSRWFAGDEFSAADVQMSFPLEAAASRGGLDANRPRLMDFLARIHERPAYRRALEKGGPYELMR